MFYIWLVTVTLNGFDGFEMLTCLHMNVKMLRNMAYVICVSTNFVNKLICQ